MHLSFLIIIISHTCSSSTLAFLSTSTFLSTFTSIHNSKLQPNHKLNQTTREMQSETSTFRIGYSSDIEGHWDYFLHYVSRSNVLDWHPTSSSFNNKYSTYRLDLRPNAHFVYGGDSVDKGPGDIRFTRCLVDLKKRYPNRVHLLVGNRDLNKLRFSSELSEYEMGLDVECIPKPFWDKGALSYREYLERSGGLKCKMNKLKWMLEHTLGCPETFEFRRQEIRILKQIYGTYPLDYTKDDIHATIIEEMEVDPSISVTDEEVVQSFEHEINHPMGSLRQYLKHADIAAVVGNTIFVHGAIDALTMKYVPSLQSKFELPTCVPSSLLLGTPDEPTVDDGTMVENVHEWVEALNSYLQRGLEDFEARPYWNVNRTSRGGEALLAIQNRPSMWGRSVVCNSYGDGGVIATANSEVEQMNALTASISDVNPLVFEGTASNVFDSKPAEWLLEHGIRRVVVGHKPTGDCPSVLSGEYTGVEVVSADTSYSHRKELDDPECKFGYCRGAAISTVEIVGTEYSNWLETSGSLASGKEYFNRHPLLSGDNENNVSDNCDSNLGKRLPDGWWVKAAIPPEYYHLCRGTGRLVEYDIRSKKDVCKQLNIP